MVDDNHEKGGDDEIVRAYRKVIHGNDHTVIVDCLIKMILAVMVVKLINNYADNDDFALIKMITATTVITMITL